MLQVTELSKEYPTPRGALRVLSGVSFDMAQGDAAAIMGPSGSGKSTLVHVVAGLLEPSGGSVMIDGQDITRLPAPERARVRRRNVGLVLQRDNLHPLLDVASNIALPLRIDNRPTTEIRERVDLLLPPRPPSERR